MLDAFCFAGLLVFFGMLIYATVTRAAPPAKAEPPPLAPSPVGLFCSICHAFAGTVSAGEYERICGAREPVYCESCMSTIQIYKRQSGAPR